MGLITVCVTIVRQWFDVRRFETHGTPSLHIHERQLREHQHHGNHRARNRKYGMANKTKVVSWPMITAQLTGLTTTSARPKWLQCTVTAHTMTAQSAAAIHRMAGKAFISLPSSSCTLIYYATAYECPSMSKGTSRYGGSTCASR